MKTATTRRPRAGGDPSEIPKEMDPRIREDDGKQNGIASPLPNGLNAAVTG
jgi:hypothetical protein